MCTQIVTYFANPPCKAHAKRVTWPCPTAAQCEAHPVPMRLQYNFDPGACPECPTPVTEPRIQGLPTGLPPPIDRERRKLHVTNQFNRLGLDAFRPWMVEYVRLNAVTLGIMDPIVQVKYRKKDEIYHWLHLIFDGFVEWEQLERWVQNRILTRYIEDDILTESVEKRMPFVANVVKNERQRKASAAYNEDARKAGESKIVRRAIRAERNAQQNRGIR